MRPLVLAFLWCGVLTAAADSPYAGAEACRACHPAEYERQSTSHHARALLPMAQSTIRGYFIDGPAPSGNVSYGSADGNVAVTAQLNGQTVHGTLEWAFGAGAQGITAVGVSDGRYFEHRYSYYPRDRRFDVTFGHPPGGSLERELGVWQSPKTITQCFNCHSTGVQSGNSGPDLSAMRPGVTCERCHGPGRAHIAAAQREDRDAIRRTVVNPRRFGAKAQVEMCGECHRLPVPGNESPEPEIEDPVSVRFAPVSLMASRCFSSGKLSCTTCHDPHTDARPRTDPAYADRCGSCHAGAPAASGSHCPRVSNRDCVGCHMPRAKLGEHLQFTDHRIRIP